MYLRIDAKVTHSLCVRYRNGDTKARDLLIEQFSPIINNILYMIANNKISHSGSVYKTFARSFYSKEDKIKNISLRDRFEKICKYVKMVCTEEDLYNEAIAVLLDALKKFSYNDKYAVEPKLDTWYVLKTFAYNYAIRLKKMINSASIGYTVLLYGDFMSYVEIEDTNMSVLDEIQKDPDSLLDPSCINDGRLSLLSELEMQIIIDYYLYNMTDFQIGQKLMMDRTVILNKRHGALLKIGYEPSTSMFCNVCGREIDRGVGKRGRPPSRCKLCTEDNTSLRHYKSVNENLAKDEF